MESSSDRHGVQLLPETILSAVIEAEETAWGQGGITDESTENPHTDEGDLGNLIFQHGKLSKQIHNYFTNLEQRKCCLLLAGCKQTFRSVRLVRSDGRDSGIEEGAMMKSSKGNTEMVSCLSAEDFQVFQHALRCAAFPVLGAPDPPSGSSPSPRVTPATGVLQKKPDLQSSVILARAITPHSASDSGVEEHDDAMVPAETLCELLRRAFRLTNEKFNQYEDIVASQLEKKSPQKILVEELVRQLVALENNSNTFYNPATFLNRLGYDQWQQRERTHITELIQKFWHFSLPQPTQSSSRSSYPKHGQYNRLMEKLIQYEFPYRQESENDLMSAPPTSPLSSASLRLLKEFGLRYGVTISVVLLFYLFTQVYGWTGLCNSVDPDQMTQNVASDQDPTLFATHPAFVKTQGKGDQYRKIVYLHYLAHNFEPTLWFIQHVSISLMSVMEAMPSKRSFLIIVKEEYSMLEKSLLLLDLKASAALAKMKTLFPSNQPADGIESLIELLSITVQSKSYLLMQTEERLATKLQKIIQNIFPTTYERHKLVAKDELHHSKWEVELTPRLLNMLIGHIRDEVNDYKMNYQQTFLKYFNITLEAAQEFYKLLMADLQELHRQTQEDLNTMEIDLLMLSLAYRLNQLDKDWSSYITPQMQTWRTVLLQEAQHWTIVMKVKMQSFVTEAVGQDRYENCELSWTGSLHQPSSQGSIQRYHSASFKSLTPSVNSAFSMLSTGNSTFSMVSSPHSTPGPKQQPVTHPPVIQESNEDLGPNQPTKENPTFVPLDNSRLSFKEKLFQEERRPNSDPVNISHSSVLNNTYIGDMARSLGHYENDHFLSFANIRHSSSLPNLQNDTDKKVLEVNDKCSVVKDHNKTENVLKKELDIETNSMTTIPSQHNDFKEPHLNTSKDETDNDTIKNDTNKKPDNNVSLLTNISSLNTDLKEIGGSGSPEIEILMDNPVPISTEMEDSDDSNTLTDDSLSQEGEFKFPPLEEINSVPVSPVVIAPCEPVMMSDTFTNKISIVRPSPKSSKHSSSKHTNSDKAMYKKKPRDIPKETEKTVPQNQSKHSHTIDSISNSECLGAKADTNVKESFTDSVISNVSFPSQKKHSSAVLPVSSSTIDMIVIFQRLCGIGKTLCQTFYPRKRTYSSDPSCTTTSSEEELYYQPQSYNCRQKLYDAFLNCICSTVCVFADNMLCMDLCGTSSSTATRLAGPKLVEYLQTQQRSGLIWGCRHDRQANRSCFEYMNKKTDLLCDRHEPITRDMCTRINNVMAILTFLEVYHRRLGNMFGVYGDWSVRQKQDYNMSFNSMDILKSDFIVLENYGYDPSGDRLDVFETVSQKCAGAEGNANSRLSVLVSSPIDSYKNHLLALLRAQSRIMAYRLNLFVCDALPVLLSLKAPNMTLEKVLKPITDFLTTYITELRSWLYMDSFRRVLECLWIFIVQDFEYELFKLERSEESTEAMGQVLLQAIAHLLKFMDSQHESLRKELLLEQADDVSFRLNLYAMPVLRLVSVYKGLVTEVTGFDVSCTLSQLETVCMKCQILLAGKTKKVSSNILSADIIQRVVKSFEMDDTSFDTQYQSVIHVKDRLRHDLQKLKKGFSGNDLVRWILENQSLFMNLDPVLSEASMRFTLETAYHVAQRLLDWGLIADVEGQSIRGSSPTYSLSTSFEFPDLTQIPGYSYSERAFSRQSDDSTPQATPRATPRHSLRDSIRAASRHSLIKLSTPGLNKLDKSASMASNQSLRTSKHDRTDRVIRKKENSGSSKEVSIDENTVTNYDNPVVEIYTHQCQHQSVAEIPVIVAIQGNMRNGVEKIEDNNKKDGSKELSKMENTDKLDIINGSKEVNQINSGVNKLSESIANGNDVEKIEDNNKKDGSKELSKMENTDKLDIINGSKEVNQINSGINKLSESIANGNDVEKIEDNNKKDGSKELSKMENTDKLDIINGSKEVNQINSGINKLSESIANGNDVEKIEDNNKKDGSKELSKMENTDKLDIINGSKEVNQINSGINKLSESIANGRKEVLDSLLHGIVQNSSQRCQSKTTEINSGHHRFNGQFDSDRNKQTKIASADRKEVIDNSLHNSAEDANNGTSAINENHCSFERHESSSSNLSSTDRNTPTLNPASVIARDLDTQLQETSFHGEEFDPYLPHGTPVSFSSGMSCSSHSVLFMGTNEHFYYVCPQVGNELETTLQNYEQFQLVEECYQKKILPEYILRIIYSRRRNDVNAKDFIRSLPYDLIQKINLKDSDSVDMCVSS